MQQLNAMRDVYDALGGPKGLSEITGLAYANCSTWPHRHRFPTKTYLVITEALKRSGFTAPPKLWDMIEPK